jgi:DNA-binding XRE family transcriptional regulator
MTTAERAHLVPVAVEKESVWRRRRARLDMTQQEVADAVGGTFSRDTVAAVEAGGGSARSRHKIDDTLSRLEEEAGLGPIDAPPAALPTHPPLAPEAKDKVIRFRVEGVYGADALIVEAPPENLEALEHAVDRIMRGLQRGRTRDED